MTKKSMFSVVLLKESTVDKLLNKDNTKLFEESIILLKTEEEFFEKNSQEYLLTYFDKKIPLLEYENSYGETVSIKIVCVIDYFEVIDPVEVENFTEVFSRTFIEEIGTTAEDIIDIYYSGFVFNK